MQEETIYMEEDSLWNQALVKNLRPSEFHENKVVLNLDALRGERAAFANQVIQNPGQAIKEIKKIYEREDLRVEFVGQMGQNFVTPRGLNAGMAEQLVGVQGIVTKMSQKKCLLKKGVLFNKKSEQMMERTIYDKYSPDEEYDLKHSHLNLLTKDKEGNELKLEYGLSRFRDVQSVVIQELPEFAPVGLTPLSIDVYLEDELVGSVKPGDRVQIVGIFRLNVNTRTVNHGIFAAHLLATSIRSFASFKLHKPVKGPADVTTPRMYELLCNSIAPSVFGYPELKKGILLMLLGGVEKILEGTRLRGNLNMLMVGDPGCAKSQLLRYILQTAEVGVCTSGSGASGVGLTASVSHDKDTGDRVLEAGAMVLADRGVVCIDEFDKMNEADRVAIHEVMEQQTVTIAKAGICCSLNARCSVAAAANPIYGEYRTDMPPNKNIGFPDSLLSRFDLIFIVQDKRDERLDQLIADRVIKNHMYCPKGEADGSVSEGYMVKPLSEEVFTKPSQESIYEKEQVYNTGRNKNDILSQAFLKDYINHAKNLAPEMTDAASEIVQQAWLKLRKMDFKEGIQLKVQPITIRTLESLIRLATARAKARLATLVEPEDAQEAIRLFSYSLFGDEYNELREQLIVETMQVEPEPDHSKKSSAKRKPAALEKKEEELSRKFEKVTVS
jgi:DNA replication licensing factor MCM3